MGVIDPLNIFLLVSVAGLMFFAIAALGTAAHHSRKAQRQRQVMLDDMSPRASRYAPALKVSTLDLKGEVQGRLLREKFNQDAWAHWLQEGQIVACACGRTALICAVPSVVYGCPPCPACPEYPGDPVPGEQSLADAVVAILADDDECECSHIRGIHEDGGSCDRGGPCQGSGCFAPHCSCESFELQR